MRAVQRVSAVEDAETVLHVRQLEMVFHVWMVNQMSKVTHV